MSSVVEGSGFVHSRMGNVLTAEDIAFYNALFGASAVGHFIAIQRKYGGNGGGNLRFGEVGELLRALPRLILGAAKDGGAIIGHYTRRTPRGAPNEVTCLSLDIDRPKPPANGSNDKIISPQAHLENVLARFSELRLTPTFVVSSGFGVHVYLCLAEAVSPDVANALLKAGVKPLSADPASASINCTRRLPGSVNMKDPTDPRRVTVIQSNGTTHHAETIARTFGTTVSEAVAARSIACRPPCSPVIPAVSGETALIVKCDRVARAYFNGQGLKKGDRSNSGYDWALARHLVRRGILDRAQLAAVLARRPANRAKSADYIWLTVDRALASMLEAAAGDHEDTDRRTP